MYEINLIGDITTANNGESIINYDMVKSELDNAKGQDLQIKINTLGGSVDEAFKIYNELESYKKEHKAKITTITDQNCASSGVILLLAGSSRIVNKNSMPFVHNVWTEVQGNAKELKEIAEDLESYDLKIAELYAKKTALSVDEALLLMNNDTEITPDEAYELNFATELSKVYNKKPISSKLIIQNKLNNNKQMSKEQTLYDMLKNFFVGNEKEETKTIVNKVELTVSDTELDFYELDSDSVPSLGDKANFDGQPAQGEFKMKNGKEYEFEAGILKEIKEEVEEDIEIENKKEIKNKFEITYSLSTDDKRTSLISALKDKGFSYPWIISMYDNFVVFQDDYEYKYKKVGYEISEENKALLVGDIEEVFTTFLTSDELAELKTKSNEEIQNLKEQLQEKEIIVNNFKKLESEFKELEKKEQRETVIENKNKFDFSNTNEILRKINNKK